ncbi:MAG: dTDP-4-dehydrorhamnose reductase family protein [Candidatus Acidiferrales bacterium]
MKVLVLGGDGMLGHKVVQRLTRAHEVVATVRKPPTATVAAALKGCRLVSGVDVRRPDALTEVLHDRPQVVINAVGIVKQRAAAEEPVESIEVNSLFPHELAAACREAAARLIHISTDCVFSGARGDYREADNPDPVDLYGRTKLLGEVFGPGCLTIRTSMIGLELANYTSLIEWFLRQAGDVRGYRNARWNGLTTIELARVIDGVVMDQPELHGVWHVSGQTISKYDLLASLAAMLRRDVALVPDDKVVIDRSLNSEHFRSAVDYNPPGYEAMLSELASAIREREEKHVA